MRWSVSYEHDRRDPFVDLAHPEPEQLGRDIRRGVDHWREYAGCTAAKHRRGRCHHHQHGELLRRFRGQGRGRRGKVGQHWPVELAWKRSESAEHHSRFGQWLALHHDRLSRFVGKPGPARTIVPYDLEEIGAALRRPGEEALPLDVVEDVINAFTAAGLIYRWQGRDREVDAAGVVHFRGKVALLRVTHEFLIRSGMAQLRDQRLRQEERRRQAAERREARAEELRGVIYGLGEPSRRFEQQAEHIRRAVWAEHPEWVRDGNAGRFRLDAEIDRRLQEQERRAREARERRREPPGRA